MTLSQQDPDTVTSPIQSATVLVTSQLIHSHMYWCTSVQFMLNMQMDNIYTYIHNQANNTSSSLNVLSNNIEMALSNII